MCLRNRYRPAERDDARARSRQEYMTRRMLIDATHPEETRVTVVNGNRLEEFDYETATKQQVKGNIYLAKVTRVEPSLQAAFVEYGGNRHGFLAFSEIHPDYYRIPVSDREELIEDDGAEDDEDGGSENGDGEDGSVENIGAGEGVDEAVEESAKRRPRLKRHYKIQEVINRRQVMLIQVVKEERGTKGAALTTYLSLAGRYCVVMPNTSRGGGVSRKIANAQDRKRLKSILSELNVPDGMAVILRTAGAERSKAEVKRDFDYIMRLWDEIREKTLSSTAPSLIHEEGSLIKRAIRDVYTKDIEEVLVAGDEGYRTAKNFMKNLIPSHAKKVQPYKDEQGIPLLHRYQVEQQLAQIYDSTVQLRSGGSIVIHQTEALVAIDVNSGKATRERHIEETALKTNLEAAEEVARQLRLRDLAGLIVIDFIDMEENRNDHAVERRLKEALRKDRARIQVGRISAFGLLEMSRQRLRPSLLEAMTQSCPSCGGTGYIVSTESAALTVTRAVEEECLRRRASHITVRVPGSVALYVLNQKRTLLSEIEERYGIRITIEAADGMLPPQFEIQRSGSVSDDADDDTETSRDNSGDEEERDDRQSGGSRRSRRGRRRGRGRDNDDRADNQSQQDDESDDDQDDQRQDETRSSEEDEGGSRRRRKRGRRGGRRRNRNRDQDGPQDEAQDEASQDDDADSPAAAEDGTRDENAGEQDGDTRRRRPRGRRRPKQDNPDNATSDDGDGEIVESSIADDQPSDESGSNADEAAESKQPPAKKARRSRKKARAAKPEPAAAAESVADETPSGEVSSDTTEEEAKPARAARKTRSRKSAPAKAEVEQSDATDNSSEQAPPETAPVAEGNSAESEPEAPSDDTPAPTASLPEPANNGGPESEQAEEQSDPQPKRRGWWNRIRS